MISKENQSMLSASCDTVMDRLAELTIVTLSYGRQAYLLRQMEYWNGSCVAFHAIDGTKEKIPNKELQHFRDGVHYHHVPSIVYERMAYARDLIETPYATFLADDDFFIPSALCSCMERIERNRLIACLGVPVVFFYDNGSVLAKKRVPVIKRFSSSGKQPLERMKKMMRAGVPIPYAVHRRDTLLNNLSMYPKNITSCSVTPEIQYRLLLGFQGETRVMDELMWLNSFENPPVHAKGWDRKKNVVSWYTDPQMKSEVESFFQEIIRVIEKLENYDTEKLKNDLEEAIQYYIHCKQALKTRRRKEEFLRLCSAAVGSYLPESVKALLRPYFAALMEAFKFNFYRDYTTLGHLGEELLAEGTVVDFDQLAVIEETILSFHAKRSGNSK